MSRRIRVIVSYDGTEYFGWQVQPGLPTIQGAIESVLALVEGKPVPVHASGRTDAGVHALAQVAAFDLDNPIPCENLRKVFNRFLAPDIRIVDVSESAPDFHPRFQAKAKTYEYRVWREEICPPFERRWVRHHPYPLDEGAMIALAPLLEGEHDFTAFATSNPHDDGTQSKRRTIFSSLVTREGPRLIYRVRGSGFLKHMVRNVMGVLLEVGKGNINREQLLRRLEPGCGILPGPTVPASGLFLVSVDY